MRITANQYAIALREATRDKNHQEIDGAVSNLKKLLVKNNQTKILSKIIEKFNGVFNVEEGIIEAEVVSREKLGSDLSEKVRSFIKNKYTAKEVVLVNKVDDKVGGGIIIRVGDEVLDASIEGKLRSLKSKLI